MTQAFPQTARGTFTVSMTPGDPLVDRTARFTLTKTWQGALSGQGQGVMLSSGDPAAGRAGYVALETVEGTLDGRLGGFAFAQLGLMAGHEPTLTYVVVPGSGHGDLVGISGELELDVNDAGEHHYELRYAL